MSNITIPLTPELENYINTSVKSNAFESKSHFVRNAIKFFKDEMEVREILLASERGKRGIYLSGDLDDLAKSIK